MNRSERTRLGVALAAVTFCLSGRALAATSAVGPIELDVSGCPGVSDEELRRLLSVELAGRPAVAALLPSVRRVVVECAASGPALIATLSVVGAGPRASKASDLAEVPAAHRPRFLAIAIAELMAEPVEPAAPVTAPEPARPQSTAPPARGERRPPATGGPDRRPSSWGFDVAAVTLRTAGLDPLLWGGLARACVAVSGWFVVAADAEAMGNSTPVSLGTAQIVLLSASASFLARARWRPLEWDSGVGLRAGAVRLSGTPSAGMGDSVQRRTVVGAWGGPFVTTRLAAAAGPRLSFLLGIEGGYSPARVVGAVDGVTQVAVTQWWADLSLGLGWGE